VDEFLAFQRQGALAVVFSDLLCFDASFLSPDRRLASCLDGKRVIVFDGSGISEMRHQ
jgi:hypothetical protein